MKTSKNGIQFLQDRICVRGFDIGNRSEFFENFYRDGIPWITLEKKKNSEEERKSLSPDKRVFVR